MFFPESVQAPMIHWGNCLIKGIIGSALPSAKKQFLQLINLSGTLTYLNLAKMPWEGIFLTHMTQLQRGRTGVFSNKMSSQQCLPSLPWGLSSWIKWEDGVRLSISRSQGEREPSLHSLWKSASPRIGALGVYAMQGCVCVCVRETERERERELHCSHTWFQRTRKLCSHGISPFLPKIYRWFLS